MKTERFENAPMQPEPKELFWILEPGLLWVCRSNLTSDY